MIFLGFSFAKRSVYHYIFLKLFWTFIHIYFDSERSKTWQPSQRSLDWTLGHFAASHWETNNVALFDYL